MGKQEGLFLLSNSGMGKEDLISALQEKVEQEANRDGAVVFVDMFGTSCWQTAKKVAAKLSTDRRRISVITGVNLPMLVKFFAARTSVPLSRLVPLLREEGEKGIRTET